MVDIEGESSKLINSIDFGQYDFDVVLVEKEAKKNTIKELEYKKLKYKHPNHSK